MNQKQFKFDAFCIRYDLVPVYKDPLFLQYWAQMICFYKLMWLYSTIKFKRIQIKLNFIKRVH